MGRYNAERKKNVTFVTIKQKCGMQEQKKIKIKIIAKKLAQVIFNAYKNLFRISLNNKRADQTDNPYYV